MTLRTKFLIALFGLLVTMLAAVHFVTQSWQAFLRTELEDSASSLLVKQGAVLSDSVLDAQRMLKLLVLDEDIQGTSLDAARAKLSKWGKQSSPFEAFYLNTLSGEVFPATGPAFSVRDRPYFPKVVAGEEVIGEPIISRQSNVPVLLLTAPIRDQNGLTKGALGGTLLLENLIAKIVATSPNASATTTIFDNQGRVLATSDTEPVTLLDVATENSPKLFQLWKTLSQTGNHPVAEVQETSIVSGHEEILVHFVTLPSLGWHLVHAQALSELLAPARQATTVSLAILALVFLTGIIVIVALERMIVQPIRRLKEAHLQLESGDMSVRVAVEGGDEISALSRTFNQTASKLALSEDKFEAIFEAFPAPIALNRLSDGAYIDVNPAFEIANGRSRAEIIGLKSSDQVVMVDPEDHRRASEKLITTGQLDAEPARTVKPDGSEVWLIYSTRLLTIHGQPVALSVVTDVTKLKQVELALRESQASLMSIFDHAPVAMSYSPVASGVPKSYWNQTWYETFGYARGSKDGQGGGAFAFWCNPGQREAFINQLMIDRNVANLEARLRHADGSERICLVSATAAGSGERALILATYLDITEQRANELQLREFGTMVENANDGMFFIDRGLITETNPAMERMFRAARSDIIGISPGVLSPPVQGDGRSSVDAAQTYIAQAIETGSARFIWQHRRMDGTTFLAQVALSGVAGYPQRVVAVLRDVTEEQAVAQALELSEARFRSTIAVSNTGAWEYHEQADYLWCSPEYLTMLGRNPDSYKMGGKANLKETWLNLLHPDDRERASQSFANYLKNGSIGMYESQFRMQHADGSWAWIWSRGQTLRDPDNNVTDVTVGTHVDITQRKETERKLEELNQTLEARVERRTAELAAAVQRVEQAKGELADTNIVLQTVISTLPIRVFWKDRDSRYLGCNPVFARDTGRQTPTEVVGLYDFDLLPEQAELYRADDREVMNSAQPRLNFEEPQTTPDGRTIWLSTSKVPLSDAAGNVIGILGIYDDITARKQAELDLIHSKTETDRVNADLSSALENLQRTQTELIRSEKLAALGSLVAGVAHELNTPIGNAVTVATTVHDAHAKIRILLDTGMTRNALVDFIDTVGDGAKMLERNLHRAADLVTNFKQLAVDQSSYQRREFNLHEAVEEVRVVMAPALRKAKVVFESTIPSGVRLNSYPGPLTQGLMILVSNSLVHAFSDKGKGCIQISATLEEPGWITVLVSDDGSGIPKKNLDRIFEPFFTTKLGRGGSGLGLHIFFNIVTGVLAGRVAVDSKIDQGTRFVISIPKSPPTAQLNQFEV